MPGRANGSHNALGGCGVSTFASKLPEMRVRNLKSAPISQVAFMRWLAGLLLLPNESVPVRPRVTILAPITLRTVATSILDFVLHDKFVSAPSIL